MRKSMKLLATVAAFGLATGATAATQAAAPAAAAAPAKAPAKDAKPAKPAKVAKAAKPAKPAKVAEAKPAKPAKPAKAPKPAVSMSQARSIAHKSAPGKIIKSASADGRYVFDIKQKGNVTEVAVDANTGKVVESKSEAKGK